MELHDKIFSFIILLKKNISPFFCGNEKLLSNSTCLKDNSLLHSNDKPIVIF
jgi:hypothetical protein